MIIYLFDPTEFFPIKKNIIKFDTDTNITCGCGVLKFLSTNFTLDKLFRRGYRPIHIEDLINNKFTSVLYKTCIKEFLEDFAGE